MVYKLVKKYSTSYVSVWNTEEINIHGIKPGMIAVFDNLHFITKEQLGSNNYKNLFSKSIKTGPMKGIKRTVFLIKKDFMITPEDIQGRSPDYVQGLMNARKIFLTRLGINDKTFLEVKDEKKK